MFNKLMLIAVGLLIAAFLAGCGPVTRPPAQATLPTAETRYVVTVMCGNWNNGTKDVYYTNDPTGKGPALEIGLFSTKELNGFGFSDGCQHQFKGETYIWSSQPPFSDNTYSTDQSVIDQFLADSK